MYLRDVISTLNTVMGVDLVSTLSDDLDVDLTVLLSRDGGSVPVPKWIFHSTAAVSTTEENRLLVAYEIVARFALQARTNDVRSWYLRSYKILGDKSAINALRDDRFDDAHLLAVAYLSGV